MYKKEDVSTNTLEDFVGNTVTEKPEEKRVVLPCLYDKNEVEYDESFVGYNQVIDGRLYLSHRQVMDVLGTYRPDGRFIDFILDGTEFNTVKVLPLEELFKKCIAVEFQLKDKLRG